MTMKLVCEVTVRGVTSTRVLTTATGADVGAFVRSTPGIGKPFLVFNTLPGTVAAVDFTGAPLVTGDAAENNRLIAEMLANPEPYLAMITFA